MSQVSEATARYHKLIESEPYIDLAWAEALQARLRATQPLPAECFVSLLLRPVIGPEVPGYCAARTMEIRFFAPGSLVSNLDFVESIFGNAGDPTLPDLSAPSPATPTPPAAILPVLAQP